MPSTSVYAASPSPQGSMPFSMATPMAAPTSIVSRPRSSHSRSSCASWSRSEMPQFEPRRPRVSNSKPEVIISPASSVYTCEQLTMQPVMQRWLVFAFGREVMSAVHGLAADGLGVVEGAGREVLGAEAAERDARDVDQERRAQRLEGAHGRGATDDLPRGPSPPPSRPRGRRPWCAVAPLSLMTTALSFFEPMTAPRPPREAVRRRNSGVVATTAAAFSCISPAGPQQMKVTSSPYVARRAATVS